MASKSFYAVIAGAGTGTGKSSLSPRAQPVVLITLQADLPQFALPNLTQSFFLHANPKATKTLSRRSTSPAARPSGSLRMPLTPRP
ncbi:hypothetical protein BN1708_002045 [Verticillium longisporum]|uniref:Uncharacterized protein n=1 Tax=Verticillium longisporum TaxID=100787 RepID=A0A0G4KGW4_VERLO|nr:hypothetical protein BN1708_002045 [Verticillium longisporum]